MSCEKKVGVKNIAITFHNCETNETVGPIAHELDGNDLPMIRSFDHKSEELSGGYVKLIHTNSTIELTVRRVLRIPLKDYQGRSAISIQIEYYNGLVYTALDGSIRGEESSDTHSVKLSLTFETVDELLPEGGLMAA